MLVMFFISNHYELVNELHMADRLHTRVHVRRAGGNYIGKLHKKAEGMKKRPDNWLKNKNRGMEVFAEHARNWPGMGRKKPHRLRAWANFGRGKSCGGKPSRFHHNYLFIQAKDYLILSQQRYKTTQERGYAAPTRLRRPPATFHCITPPRKKQPGLKRGRRPPDTWLWQYS